jgi:hypothetical protein
VRDASVCFCLPACLPVSFVDVDVVVVVPTATAAAAAASLLLLLLYYYPNFSLLSFSWEIFTYPGMYHQQD